MYYEYYSFREKPFNLTPDPRFIYLSRNHKEAIAHLLYGIDNRAGFISLTGEVGTGKTTILRALLDHINTDRYRTAIIFNPCISPPQLLRNICRELNIGLQDDPLDALNQYLLEQNALGRTVVLVIDEAQNLDRPVLEQVRLLSNLETSSEKLVQIILAGQPELLQMLARKEFRQLNQRITVRYHLQPLDFPATVDYINHRLDIAKGRVVFSRGAARAVFRFSRGYPRLINASCDRALLAGYTKNELVITKRTAMAGISDLKKCTRAGLLKGRFFLAPALILACIIVTAYIFYFWKP